MSKINPTADNIIIAPIFREAVSESGIVLDAIEQIESDRAVVESVGSDCQYVKEGDIVIYAVPQGTQITKWGMDMGKEAVRGVIKETWVIAILEE